MSEDAAIRFAVEALLEVVESEKSMEICVVRAKDSESLTEDKIASIVALVKAEKEAAEVAKKAKKQQQ